MRGKAPVSPLAQSWSSPATSTSAVAHAGTPQVRDNVQAVAPVGHVLGVEQGDLGGRRPGGQHPALLGAHAGPQVRPELAGFS